MRRCNHGLFHILYEDKKSTFKSILSPLHRDANDLEDKVIDTDSDILRKIKILSIIFLKLDICRHYELLLLSATVGFWK